MLDAAERSFLRFTYGWPYGTAFHELQRGENDHALAENAAGRYVVRRYRPGARSRPEIEAELAWITALKGAVAVPEVIPNAAGSSLSCRPARGAGAERRYAVFTYVEGTPLDPGPAAYRRLGRMLRTLQDSAAGIEPHRSPDWSGFQRPIFDTATVLGASLENIVASPLLSVADKSAYEDLAGRLAGLWQDRLTDRQFIHADVHIGNVLAHCGRLTCLDFDDSGFGPRAFDIASVRLHPIVHGYLAAVWQAFAQGYGPMPPDSDIRLATALRFFYMAGKIPLRLDHPALSYRPADRLRRYFGHIQGQLEEPGAG